MATDLERSEIIVWKDNEKVQQEIQRFFVLNHEICVSEQDVHFVLVGTQHCAVHHDWTGQIGQHPLHHKITYGAN